MQPKSSTPPATGPCPEKRPVQPIHQIHTRLKLFLPCISRFPDQNFAFVCHLPHCTTCLADLIPLIRIRMLDLSLHNFYAHFILRVTIDPRRFGSPSENLLLSHFLRQWQGRGTGLHTTSSSPAKPFPAELLLAISGRQRRANSLPGSNRPQRARRVCRLPTC